MHGGILRNHLLFILLGTCALSGCGGGGGGGGSPSVSFSSNSLTFGDEVEGAGSEPLLITLTNTGTAALAITNIAASANFTETNNCGATLAAGANCAINVTLAPDTTGSVKGTVTFTDNAAGSPQTVSLSGTAVTPSTLTGYCVGYTGVGPCGIMIFQESTECPVGQPVVTPVVSFCHDGGEYIVDPSSACGTSTLPRLAGNCEATLSAGSCSVQGQQCGAANLPPCCSGFVCAGASDRAFCQPTTGESAGSQARSSWDWRLPDRLH